MNIAFFGTSDRSIPILEALKKSKFDLVLCITKDDVKVGRKQKLKPTAVKQWAIDNRVQYLTWNQLNPETTEQTKKLLSENDIKIGVVADFSFIIPEKIFEFPKYGIVNIHFSLLPHYRGASPVQRSILNLDKTTGISYQKVVKRLDAGEIIYQSKYKLDGTETTDSLYSTLFEKSANELPEILEKYISGKLEPYEQDETQITFAPRISKDEARINWNESSERIDAMVRAYNPWPIAWTTLSELVENDSNLRVKIYKTHLENGKLKIDELQVEGKNKMSWEEFENGYLASVTASAA